MAFSLQACCDASCLPRGRPGFCSEHQSRVEDEARAMERRLSRPVRPNRGTPGVLCSVGRWLAPSPTRSCRLPNVSTWWDPNTTQHLAFGLSQALLETGHLRADLEDLDLGGRQRQRIGSGSEAYPVRRGLHEHGVCGSACVFPARQASGTLSSSSAFRPDVRNLLCCETSSTNLKANNHVAACGSSSSWPGLRLQAHHRR